MLVEIEREELAQGDEQTVEIPVLDIVAICVLLDRALDHAGHLPARLLADALALENLVAVGVDHATLLVHHVVVLEHAFADQEILFLDLLLGFLNLLREHARLDRFLVAFLVDAAQPVEDAIDAVAREQAYEIVLGGEKEAALARIPLASGAPAQLVVDAPRLVSLGAADEQPPGRQHVLAALLHASFQLGQQLARAALVGLAIAGLDALARQLESRQVLGIAAELDVDPAAGHV